MIDTANGQTVQPSLNKQSIDAQRDSNQGKGSRKSSNQLSDSPHIGQKKTSIHEEDLKPEIKEIMVKISADLEKRKMTNQKMREEMSQFPALDFEEGSFSCQKDINKEVDGNQPIRKTFMTSQEPKVLDFSWEDAIANEEKVKKNKPTTAINNIPNEPKNEEVKISEQYLKDADIRFKRRNEENNNTNNSTSQEKQNIFQETNQTIKQQYDSSDKQNKQDLQNQSQLHPQEKSQKNPQNYVKGSNPQTQQLTNPKKGPSLNPQQEQFQQQQQQQSKLPQNQKLQSQKIQLPYQPYLAYNYQQKTQSPLKIPSNKQETQNIQQQITQITDPSNPSSLLPQNTPSFNKPSTKASEPITNLSYINGQIFNPLKNTSQPLKQGEINSQDSNNLGDSRVSTQNMVEKVQFLEKEIEMLNKENGLLRLKNDFLNNRLNEMHRQNSNLSNNNSFSGNNSQNTNNLFNNSNAIQRSAYPSQAATPQHSALLKSTGNFNEPSPQVNLPFSPSNNMNLNYQNLNIDTTTQSQTNTPLRSAKAMNNNNNSNQMFFSNNQEGNNYNSGNTTKSYNQNNDQDNQLNHNNILSSVCQLLQVESPSQLVSAAQKYNRCIQSIPKLEQFVQNVYAIVLPGIPQQQRASKSSMQEVFRQISIWRDQHIQMQQSLSQQKFYFEFYRQFSLLFNVDQVNLQEPSDLLVALRTRLEEFNSFHKEPQMSQLQGRDSQQKQDQTKLKKSLQMDPSTRDDLAFKSALDKLQQFSSYRQFIRNLSRLTGITDLQQLFQEIEKSLVIKSRIAPVNAHITLGRFE